MSDKRSVSTDALETLGTIIGEGAGRDAIHLAVEPVIAAVKLHPGQDVGIVSGKARPHETTLGIVDPFLTAPVQPGERFWLILYPRQITSLRHVWTHPAFPDAPLEPRAREISEKWLRNFCNNLPVEYEELVMMAVQNDGDSICFGDEIDCDREIPDEFWDHVENVTGKKPKRASFFRCAC